MLQNMNKIEKMKNQTAQNIFHKHYKKTNRRISKMTHIRRNTQRRANARMVLVMNLEWGL